MLEVPRVVTKITKYIYKNYLVNKANNGYRGIILTGAISYKRPKSLRDSRIKIPARS